MQEAAANNPVPSDPVGEPLDPNEIRDALRGLRELMGSINSPTIYRDLKNAYESIAGITVVERQP